MKKEVKKEKKKPIPPDVTKIINWDSVDALAKIAATGEEIAFSLGIDYETLNRHSIKEKGMPIREYIKRGCATLKISLRRTQVQLANGWKEKKTITQDGEKIEVFVTHPPSIPMSIWLGKQLLGQSEKLEQTNEVNTNDVIAALDKLNNQG